MAATLKDRVAHALVWTTDQIEPGRGKGQVRVMDMYLGDIQKHLGRALPDALPRYALRVHVAETDPGGSDATIAKGRPGLFVLTSDDFLLAHDHGWASTITRGYELNGLRAEPVVCTVKGKQSAGFRIAGNGSWLIALDAAIAGRNGSQARLRDRIVSTFNGEEQAGPGERNTSGGVQTAILRLISLSGGSTDVRNPPLDEQGALVLGEHESVIHHGRHEVITLRHEPVALGAHWRTSPGPPTPADVWITNRRVAVCWTDWADDPTALQFLERRRRAGFPDEEDRMVVVVAGQLTAPWIAGVFLDTSTNALNFQASDDDMAVRVEVRGFERADAERLMREAAAAIADYRIATDPTITAEERLTLDQIKNGDPSVEGLDWGLKIGLPSNFKIGRDPESTESD